MSAVATSELGHQIAAWGETFPEVRRNAAALWDEAVGALAWFAEPGIDTAEAHRRWALVVHLVHNFKSQVLIRQPAAKWPTADPGDGPAWSSTRLARLPPLQRSIVEQVDLSWRDSVKGFGPATTTALLALLHPDTHAILDIYTAPVAAALALHEPSLADHAPAFQPFRDMKDRHRRLMFYAEAYQPLPLSSRWKVCSAVPPPGDIRRHVSLTSSDEWPTSNRA